MAYINQNKIVLPCVLVVLCYVFRLVSGQAPSYSSSSHFLLQSSYTPLGQSLGSKGSLFKHANSLSPSVVKAIPIYVRTGLFFFDTKSPDEILLDHFGISDGGGGEGGPSVRTSSSNSISCSTPEQQQGRCVPISQCPDYMNLVTLIRDPDVSRFLRDRICRLELNNVLICCPNQPQNAPLPIESTLTLSSSSSPTQGSFNVQQSQGGFTLPQSQGGFTPPQSQGGFTQPQSPSPAFQQGQISFGGSGSGRPSQSLPILPSTQPRSTTPDLQQENQNRPFPQFTTPIPQPFSPNTPNSIFPNRIPQDSQIQLPVSLPILPPLLPSQTSTQGVNPTSTPLNGVSFAPSDLLPDRVTEQQLQETLTQVSSTVGGPVNLIPLENECGSSELLRNLRSNRLSNWPWLAAVGYSQGGNFEVICGGAIITRRHIITAAHCMNDKLAGKGIPTDVRIGDYDLNRSNDVASPQTIGIVTHRTPGHDAKTFANDIAIITLSANIEFNEFVEPICLPYRFKYDGFRYQNVSSIGWGNTVLLRGRDDLPSTPNPFEAPVLTLGECRKTYKQTSQSVVVDRRNLCIEGGTEDTCLRDSGALAVYLDEDISSNFFLVGLGSFGFGCDRPQEPFVYTRIGAYINWIEEVILNGS